MLHSSLAYMQLKETSPTVVSLEALTYNVKITNICLQQKYQSNENINNIIL